MNTYDSVKSIERTNVFHALVCVADLWLAVSTASRCFISILWKKNERYGFIGR